MPHDAHEIAVTPNGRARGHPGSVAEVFGAALRLGLTSFGGPIAHLGYFRDDYVVRRRWLDDQAYGELVGLCQFLPGPASSQLGFAIGWLRAGPRGALAAWLGFTLPSALLMLAFALASRNLHGPVAAAAVRGLEIAAVAVVAQAVIGMARTMTRDLRRIVIAIGAGAAVLLTATPATQLFVIAGGALAGMLLCKDAKTTKQHVAGSDPGTTTGLVALALFLLLLLGLPILAARDRGAAFANIFFRAGAFVFGGGHVVLPLLRESLVPHWIADGTFLAGYGAAQAMPGPLFTLASYLGALAFPGSSTMGAALATLAIFLPGLLLVTTALAFRVRVMGSRRARRAMAGVNAAVVGILAAALYDPLWKAAMVSAAAVVAAIALLLLLRFKASPILVVILCVVASVAIA